MYIFNQNLRPLEKIRFELQKIYGIGKCQSFMICDNLGLSEKTLVKDVSRSISIKLQRFVQRELIVGADLKREIKENIQRHIVIGSYKGFRHVQKLPVRGQRTKSHFRVNKKKSGMSGGSSSAKKPTKAAAL